MKKIVLIAIVFFIAIYAYVAINEDQKEKLLAKRVPKIKKVNKYEVSRAIYQIRETRKAIKLKEEMVKDNTSEDIEDEVNYLDSIKKGPANPASPIDDQDFYHRQNNDYQQEDSDQEEPVRENPVMRFPKGINIPKRFVDEEQYQEEEPEEAVPARQEQLQVEENQQQ